MPDRHQVRALRKAMGLSVSKFADKLGVGKASVWRWESPHTTQSPSPMAQQRLSAMKKELQQASQPERVSQAGRVERKQPPVPPSSGPQRKPPPEREREPEPREPREPSPPRQSRPRHFSASILPSSR